MKKFVISALFLAAIVGCSPQSGIEASLEEEMEITRVSLTWTPVTPTIERQLMAWENQTFRAPRPEWVRPDRAYIYDEDGRWWVRTDETVEALGSGTTTAIWHVYDESGTLQARIATDFVKGAEGSRAWARKGNTFYEISW